MNILVISHGQKGQLALWVEAIGYNGQVDNVAVVDMDYGNECGEVKWLVRHDELAEERQWDFILYAPALYEDRGIAQVVELLKSHGAFLREGGRIQAMFPAMPVGGKPQYTYEELFFELSSQGFVVQDVKATQFVSGGEMVIGYALTIARRKKQLLVLNSQNPLIKYNIDQIAEAYQNLGWSVLYGEPDGNLYQLLQEGIDRLFVINNTGWIANVGESEVNIWEQLGITSVNYILDHPVYYDDTLSLAPGNGTLLCVDKKHVDYVHRFYPEIYQCLFMPLAGDNRLDGIGFPWEDREIEVLYVGGYKGDLNRNLLPDGGEEILEKVLQNRNSTVEEIIEQHLRSKEGHICDSQLLQEIIKYRKVDWYIMTYIRVEVVRALVRGGINVTVYGGGWEAFDEFENPHFIYKGKASQQECLENMKNSKVVLNVMPWFKEGTHDRVINAMLAGAVALTDGSAYMSRAFAEGKEYVSYDLAHLEALPEIVRGILSTDNLEMRRRAYEKAVEKHRWINRIQELEKHLTGEK